MVVEFSFRQRKKECTNEGSEVGLRDFVQGNEEYAIHQHVKDGGMGSCETGVDGISMFHWDVGSCQLCKHVMKERIVTIEDDKLGEGGINVEGGGVFNIQGGIRVGEDMGE